MTIMKNIIFLKIAKKKIITLVGSLFFLLASSNVYADAQYWQNIRAWLFVHDRLMVRFDQELRVAKNTTGKNTNTLNYSHFDISGDGIAVKLGVFRLLSGIGYRQVFSKNLKGIWTPEYMPHTNVNFLFLIPFNGSMLLEVQDRNRLEYRVFDHQEPTIRYRNRILAAFYWNYLPSTFIKPYAFVEVYVNLLTTPWKEPGKEVGLEEHRYYVGLDFGFLGKKQAFASTIGPYYEYRVSRVKNSTGQWAWQEDHIFAIQAELFLSLSN